MHAPSARSAFWITVAALLAIMAAVQVTSALQESQTWDEGIHLAAGYSYWKTGDYRLNPDHPPLFKLLFSLPLLPLNPSLPTDTRAWETAEQVEFGHQFLYRNRVPADTLLFLGRSVPILLTLVFGFVLAWWTRREFGAAPALLALFLFTFDPNLIAHGRYVTSDMMVTAFIFFAAIAWVKFFETARYRDLVLAAVLLGLALSTKYSALFLPPLLLLFYLFRWWQQGRSGPFSAAHFARAALITAAICLAIVCLTYAPQTARSLRAPQSPTRSIVTRLRMPIHPYMAGLRRQIRYNRVGHPSYLLGQRSRTGWRYYFPVVFAVKTPTSVLLLCAICLGLAVIWLPRVRLRAIPPRWLVLTVTPVVFFLFCLSSHIDLGVRYLLPVYPFLFVVLAALLFDKRLDRFRRPRAALLSLVVLIQLVESIRIYPDYLAFFNTLSGGPGRGPEYLVDSNIDWGQDVKKLRKYLDSIGWNQPVCLSYFGNADPVYYGVNYQGLPITSDFAGRKQADCIAAISVTQLYDTYSNSDDHLWLRRLRPMAKIGYSIYLYDLRKPTQ